MLTTRENAGGTTKREIKAKCLKVTQCLSIVCFNRIFTFGNFSYYDNCPSSSTPLCCEVLIEGINHSQF